MRTLLALAVATAAWALVGTAHAEQRLLTAFDGKDSLRWQTVNDGVMGGRSKGDFAKTRDGTLRFAGDISLENNGGFSSIRSRRQPLQLGGFDGLEIRVRGDGRTYKLTLRTSGTSSWIAYWADFETTKGAWATVRIPFSKWAPTTFGRKLKGPRLKPSLINSVGFMLYDKKSGAFSLEVDSITAFRRASEPKSAPTAAAKPRASTIVETAKTAGRFKILLAAAKAAGLVDALSGAGPLTVFAPSDAAFAKLPEGAVEKLLEPSSRDALRTVLLHHVVDGDISLPALLRGAPMTTLSGQHLAVSFENGGVRIDEAIVVTPELRCENGVIHVVDRVMFPEMRNLAGVASEAGTFKTLVQAATAAGLLDALVGSTALTVFAPTDAAFAALPKGTLEKLLEPENRDALKRILLHHVVKGRVYADGAAAAGSASSLAGTELRFRYSGGLKVNETRIIRQDLPAQNGVIHVVDAVLLPPQVEAEVRPSQQGAPARAMRVIERAIDAGVPLFNDGNPEACCTLYEFAATALLGLDGELFSKRVRANLEEAIDSSAEPRARAWILRRALDAANREARSRLEK